MNIFLIKFNTIDDETSVYDVLYELAEGEFFIPFDNHTFILRTSKPFSQIKRKLTFELETTNGFLVINISNTNPKDFFIDNTLELEHIQDFIKDAQETNDDKDGWENSVNKLLDKISEVGIKGMNEQEMELLKKYSQN